MFWQSKQMSSPHLEALLNRADCTIYDLMDDEDILQECKSQNKKLLEFLTRPAVMEELISLLIENPTYETSESHRFKYPHMACEILSCDIPTLNEKLAGEVGLLQKLYSFIDTEEPLNPLLASFFSKAMSILVVRSKDQNWYSYQFTCLQVFDFLKSKRNAVDLLLYHLETSAIMNLVLTLVTLIEGAETRQNYLVWLDSQQLVQRLIKLLSPQCQPLRHSNVAELLSDMINDVRDIQKNSTERSVESDPILCTLESEETTRLLLDTILVEDKLESSIVGGIQVLLTLLKPKTNGNIYDENRSSSNLEESAEKQTILKISNATIPYLEKFHDLLLCPPYMPSVKTTAGVLEVPVGSTRLYVLKLISTLLSVDNENIRAKLVELDVFQTMLDLFFKYPWNNFLHTQVQNALKEALDSVFPATDIEFYEHIFVKCQLLDKILNVYSANDVKSNRLGYMGHIIEISKNLAAQCEKNNVLTTFITTNLPQNTIEQWQSLINKDLVYIKSIQETLSSPELMYDDSDMSCTYHPDSNIMHVSPNMYGQQGQQMELNYVEIHENRNEMYKDGEEPLLYTSTGDQPGNIMLNPEEQAKSEKMFNELCECNEKLSFDDDDAEDNHLNWTDDLSLKISDEVMKNSIMSNVDKPQNRRPSTDWWSPENTVKFERSSSSEEEDDNEKDEEVGNSMDFWKAFPNVNALQPINPWDVNAPIQSESDNWANFASNWPTESENTINSEAVNDDKVNDANWACFANFDSVLSFATQDNEVPEVTKEEVVNETPHPIDELVQKESTYKEAVEEEQATKSNVDAVHTSDDDNANPIVMIENRISEVTEDKNCDENVQNSVETVNSSDDGSSLEIAIESTVQTVQE